MITRLPRIPLVTILLMACTGLMAPNFADARGGGGGGGGGRGGGGGGGFRGGGFGGGGYGGYRGGYSGFSGYSRGGYGGSSFGGGNRGTTSSGFRGTGGLNESGFSRGGLNGTGHVPAAPVTSRMNNGMGRGQNGFGGRGYGNRGFYGNRFGFFGPYWGFGWGFGPWWWWGGLGYGLYAGYGGYGGYGGDGGGYYNPYFTDNYLYGGYDYGQPLPETAPSSDDDASFSQARADFYSGNYRKALLDLQPALQGMSGSLDVHEFHALIYFALGDFYRAAAVSHTVLEGGPGWNWDTLQSLYSSPEVYTQQLRALEHDVNEHPENAATRFLLGYQYAMLGHLPSARHQFQKVVALEPRDKLSAAILANLDRALNSKSQPATPGSLSAMKPPEAPSAPGNVPGPPEGDAPGTPGAVLTPPAPPSAPGNAPNPPDEESSTSPGTTPARPATLTPAAKAIIGTWQANPMPGFVIEATLQPDGHFAWKASQGGHSETFTGTYAVDRNSLVLTRTDGQKMDGVITMKGAAGFNFHSKVTPAEDPGLNFSK